MNNGNSKKNFIKCEIILLLAAILWGSCFLFQKKGMDYIGPFTLGSFRFLIGGILLIPVIYVMHNMDRKKNNERQQRKKGLIKSGMSCGIALFFGASLQQVGLIYTTSGKAGFITSMEMIVVTVITVFITKKISVNVMIGIGAAVAGMYFLCLGNGISFQIGDAIVLSASIFFGFQIILIDKYSKWYNVIELSFIEFMTSGILSVLFMIILEEVKLNNIILAAGSIIYTAVIEVAVCYTLQMVGQKYVPPVIASVTLTMQSVFAVIFGVIILSEPITVKEICGCIFILAAVIIVQMPAKISYGFDKKADYEKHTV